MLVLILQPNFIEFLFAKTFNRLISGLLPNSFEMCWGEILRLVVIIRNSVFDLMKKKFKGKTR